MSNVTYFSVAYDMCNYIKKIAKDNFPNIFIYLFILSLIF
jgi:hypothetical protein